MAPLRVPQENGEWLNIDDEIRNIAGAGGSISTAVVHIASSDILALDSSPIELVAAQGAGSIVMPLFVMWWGIYGSGPAYTFGSGNVILAVGSDWSWHADGFISTAGFGDGPVDELGFDLLMLTGSPAGDPAGGAVNVPVTLSATAAFTDGTGSITATTYYLSLTP